MNNETPEYLLWLDFETTGLDTAHCEILEVAVALTRADDLTPISGGEWLVRRYFNVFDHEPDLWPRSVREMHDASGLTDALRVGPLRSIVYVEDDILLLLDSHMSEGASLTLAGSGVATYDLPIVRRVMPLLAERLTYHVHDVGVMRRAYRRATGHDLTPRTEPAHRAMADVQQSLTEGRAFADLFRAKAE